METVIIVGASSSIGGAVTDKFRTSGQYRVITTYTANPPKDAATQEAVPLDLRDNASIQAFAKRIQELTPRVDAAIFLSGILPGKSLAEYDFAAIDEVMTINFSGQAKLAKLLLPLLTSRSRLLFCSSIAAQKGSFDPIYAASKGALLSLVKSLANRLPQGARVNAIAPGLILDSTMFAAMTPSNRELHRSQVPSGQLLRKEDFAAVVFDLCRDHWSQLNGACIDLNGGQHVR
jgi:3-oxoacyl-[acyl-carrier protein] reductase